MLSMLRVRANVDFLELSASYTSFSHSQLEYSDFEKSESSMIWSCVLEVA